MAEVFTIAPASTKALWVLGGIGGLLLALLLLFGYFAYSSRWTRYEVSPAGLTIRGTLYGRSLPWASLEIDRARIVNLGDAPDLQPTIRTNGLGLPGYQAGWFRLRGRVRALLFLTDRSRVVAIPTREGYTLLLSVRDPGGFLVALQQAVP